MNGKAIRVLIVDDEKLARKRLTRFLRAQTDVEIVGICANGPDAIAAIERTTPDVVFLDVQMPNLDGFELLTQLPAERIPRVVFVTAYDEYAVRAFEVGALDYLLKPFDQARFEQAFHRVRNEIGRNQHELTKRLLAYLEGVSPVAAEPSPPPPPPTLDRLMIKNGGRVFFVRAADIRWVEAADNYVHIHVGKDSHLFRQTLNAIEQGLDPRKFMRIHRSTLVNLDCVREIQEGVGREHFVVLEDGTRLRLSDRYRRRLEERSLPPC
jgi:two-component system LytT family response regulator